MSSSAPDHVFAAEPATPAVEERSGIVAWLLGRVQYSLCALHGHDSMLQYERNRIFLRCTSCGHETPGWEVAQNATLHHHAPELRARLARHADLAVARKIA
jgi:hypothetical protein